MTRTVAVGTKLRIVATESLCIDVGTECTVVWTDGVTMDLDIPSLDMRLAGVAVDDPDLSAVETVEQFWARTAVAMPVDPDRISTVRMAGHLDPNPGATTVPTESYAQFHVNEVARAARAAHARLMRGEVNPLHVYYQPFRIEAFADGEVPDLSWALAWDDPVPTHLTADALVQWFAARAGNVPYLAD